MAVFGIENRHVLYGERAETYLYGTWPSAAAKGGWERLDQD